MNLNHLALFFAVAEEGSISRGAERLHISQPAVSKQVHEFEQTLGLPLFERHPKGVRLTEAGRLLADYARQIFALETEATRAMRELRGLERGLLRLGASTTIGGYLLPALLGAFHKSHPGIEIRLEIANSEVIQEKLRAYQLDAGLTEGFAGDKALSTTVFAEDKIVAIVPPSHTLRWDKSITAARFCQEPLIMREAGSGTRAVVEEALGALGIHAAPVMALGSTEAIKQAVAAGLGVAFVSHLTVSLEQESNRLAVLTLADFAPRRPLHLQTRRGHPASRAAQAFLESLRLFFPGTVGSPGAGRQRGRARVEG